MRISEPLPRLTPDLRVTSRVERERDGRHQASAGPMGESTRPDLIIRARTIQSLERLCLATASLLQNAEAL